jgi:seryl-tRNA(Sec) selenium transferase
MNTQDKNTLIQLLKQFFSEYDINERGVLFNNDAAKCLKQLLVAKNRWKNLSRGKLINSDKHIDNLNKAAGNDCPF